MKYVEGLSCKECGRGYPISPQHVCEFCFGPLEVSYDYDAVAAAISRAEIESGPTTIWRYESLLPAPEQRVDIGAGFTRLREAPRLAAEIGLRKLWLKLDGGNPTHSFKDRVVSVALSAARHFGYEVAACASTGNLANAVAAHAGAGGMKSVVFIPSDLESGKVGATTIYGGKVVAIEGNYDDANRLCAELVGSRPWAFVNVNVRPYYSEGSKTLGFEIAEQLGWRCPDALVVPLASGSLYTKVAKGLNELHRVGLLEEPPHTVLHGAQAEGCSPIAAAFAAGLDDVAPVRPRTVARSLAIGNPADGVYALDTARATSGSINTVAEERIVEGMKLLARTEGVFTETAGGVVVSALEELVGRGAIAPGDETVVLITGIGLKTLEVLGRPQPTHRIYPAVEEVDAIFSEPAVSEIPERVEA
ncbi:MAG TPA: threonine synthase [Actinomycetota bacterium]|nr:threonine synthase [Actinomycetota bacterium]